jgi:hypothetical protein
MIDNEEIPAATDIINTTIQFINSTNSHVFLTGKAGTGKTTFLKNLSARTHKQFAVVAPTGIAALNAGGVTIHSQFLLPFGMFLPEVNPNFSSGNFYTSDTLARHHPLNSARKQVLRSIDLLVIDEVSMLRCDLLDAIDYRLKAARSNFAQSFGGVQLLLIGDLFQLPPVVKQEEETIIKRHYNSQWFFESKALREDGFVYIELDKIFRQKDDKFICLLNNLRNNRPTASDIQVLNQHYKSAEEIDNLKEVVITLTTHNYKADDLNQRALKALKSPSHLLSASVEGDFPESMFPVQQQLELKEGAQIMFTKNDSETKMYFNGKLATVKSISGNEVKVEFPGSNIPYTLKKEIWENKRYTVDPSTHEITDEIVGTFEQYPVKLAWAITVHKSQGLTFDKAIIDVGNAFADGQVYVALSRLRSLDGLVLRTRISPDVISTDKQIVTFSEGNNQPGTLPVTLRTKQRHYIQHLINRTFEFETLLKQSAYAQRSHDPSETISDTAKSVLEQIAIAFVGEKENTAKFRKQLQSLLEENNYQQVLERMKKGSDYYTDLLWKQMKVLLLHMAETGQKKRMKSYLTSLTELDVLFSKKLHELDKVLHVTECILEGRERFDFSKLTARRAAERETLLSEIRTTIKPMPEKRKKGRTGRKRNKTSEPSTYELTFTLLKSGKNIPEIAVERALTVGTIEGHLAKFVEAGRISIFDFMSHEAVQTIENCLKEMPEGFTSADLFKKLKGRFSYGQLRAVMSYCQQKKPSVNIGDDISH